MMDRQILVVEDDPILRRFISDVLKRKGCKVTASENGRDALQEVQKKNFHLILDVVEKDRKL